MTAAMNAANERANEIFRQEVISVSFLSIFLSWYDDKSAHATTLERTPPDGIACILSCGHGSLRFGSLQHFSLVQSTCATASTDIWPFPLLNDSNLVAFHL